MDATLFDRIIGQITPIKSIKHAAFYFSGEPLLNPRLAEMLSRTKKETSVERTDFHTNGMLLTEQACRKLSESEVDTIIVSIDGDTPLENDAIRIRSNYFKVRENVLRARKILDKTRILIHNIRIPSRAELGSRPQVPKFLADDFGPGTIHSGHAMRWPGLTAESATQQGLEISTAEGHATKAGLGFCTMPFNEIVVRANGEVTACCYDITGELRMGNIRTSDLLEIWNNSKYRSLRQAIATFGVTKPLPDTCRKCQIYSKEVLVRASRKPDRQAMPVALAGALPDGYLGKS